MFLFLNRPPNPLQIVDSQQLLFNMGIFYFTDYKKCPSAMERNREEYPVPEGGM